MAVERLCPGARSGGGGSTSADRLRNRRPTGSLVAPTAGSEFKGLGRGGKARKKNQKNSKPSAFFGVWSAPSPIPNLFTTSPLTLQSRGGSTSPVRSRAARPPACGLVLRPGPFRSEQTLSASPARLRGRHFPGPRRVAGAQLQTARRPPDEAPGPGPHTSPRPRAFPPLRAPTAPAPRPAAAGAGPPRKPAGREGRAAARGAGPSRPSGRPCS